MLQLLQMWAIMEVLGIVFLPLTITVFQNLPDRGWAFSKAIGLAVLAFGVWLPLMTLQFLPFSQIFIAGVLLILLALNILGFLRVRKTLVGLVRSHLLYIICAELIFLGMVFLLGWLRSYTPDIRSFEMFMDEGFLAAIMRSQHFPPNDMWYAGQSINYYYYAHYNIALLAKLIGQSPAVAFNTGISVFFGLTAVNLFGVTSNAVAWAQQRRRLRATVPAHPTSTDSPSLSRAIPYGILSILLGEILGNLAATQTWWQSHGDLPDFYWFNASRIVTNTINEFPAFSFLLSCFHAHVLALAFTILSVGLALNILLDLKGQGLNAFGHGWRLPLTLLTTALVLGSLFAMNGWDYPTYLALTLVCLVLQQWLAHNSRLSLDMVLDAFTACAALGALSYFLFTPFYLNFVSPAQGLGIVAPVDRTPLVDEVLIYGVFAFIFISLLLACFFRQRTEILVAFKGSSNGKVHAQTPVALAASTGQPVAESEVSATTQVSALATPSEVALAPEQEEMRPAAVGTLPEIADASNGAGSQPEGGALAFDDDVEDVEDVESEPLEMLGTGGLHWLDMRVIGVLATLLVGIVVLLVLKNSLTFVVTGGLAAIGAILAIYHLHERERSFILLVGAVACALVAFCEVIFLRDVFAGGVDMRMNTVFKFYFQAWALLSIVGGAGVYFIIDSLRPILTMPVLSQRFYRVSLGIWGIALLGFLLMGAVYPLTAPAQRYNQFAIHDFSLNGLDYMSQTDPGDYQAINWLNSTIQGAPTIVEAVGDDYSDYGRVSIFTGLPTPMGWWGHEYQWRVNWINRGNNSVDFNQRVNDVREIYTSTSQSDVLDLMARYNARYLYVGPLEQASYLGANLQRFQGFMNIAYQANGVTIYQIR